MNANIEFAHNPELSKTRSVLRPLTARENMLRAKALSARTNVSQKLACSGQVFAGIFFDGTGNNEMLDYISVRNQPKKQKHSNVVRLFHVYKTKVTEGTDRYFQYYIPGVGTPFPEINDSGGKLGTGASWNGEPRLIWGITRVFNAVSNFISDKDVIPSDLAGKIAQNIGGFSSFAALREHAFGKYWVEEVKKLVANQRKNRPRLDQINLSVFGFSRGAAEARAFVNWLYAICEKADGGYSFAGIPIRVEFLGIFDTVASVGLAGGFSSGLLGVEGRQSWASNNMQIHPGVESCLHIVAAHEVRSTFPLDSVRIDGKYPPNVKEYVYPGAHSDVGGGYSETSQGKSEALARIPGFEMYCAALAAGVPFRSLSELKMDIKTALIPNQAGRDAFDAYMKAASVARGPVEEMTRAHMGHYLTYRHQARREPYTHPSAQPYYMRPFFQRTTKEKEFLQDSQQHFIAILAAACVYMEDCMKGDEEFDTYLDQPFQSLGKGVLGLLTAPNTLAARRILALLDRQDVGKNDQIANDLGAILQRWKAWLNTRGFPLLRDEKSPERDLLTVIESISIQPQSAAIYEFFDYWVHDSMAGLASDGVNEFLLNGIGLAKFRRTYFGNNGDQMLRERTAALNEEARAAAAQRRKRRA
ncbi:T6SS phospholipase effector Tle1-like catalytic domain-containing protein [Pseudoduganella buxea]|uniref:T6SS phospholipase effector Tle1-like catalytic domain-containing protein n=1 Tax=Pseudoduganella buxea TaxID=1949069 RepID=UPI00147817E4|nr:DUF2235 domain-containing protein [Pseudoduganella buxea]